MKRLNGLNTLLAICKDILISKVRRFRSLFSSNKTYESIRPHSLTLENRRWQTPLDFSKD